MFTKRLEAHGVRISMNGRGRVFENIFVERPWRAVQYEDIYLKDYATGPELHGGLGDYIGFYNAERPHQAIGRRRNCTSARVGHRKCCGADIL